MRRHRNSRPLGLHANVTAREGVSLAAAKGFFVYHGVDAVPQDFEHVRELETSEFPYVVRVRAVKC